MTQRQEDHLACIKARFARDMDAKYRAGAKEHGDFLLELDPLTLIRHAKEEVLDQWAYLSSIEELLLRQQVDVMPLTDRDARAWELYGDHE